MDTYQEILDHWIMCRSSYEAKGRSVLEKIGEFDSPFSLSFSLLLSSLIVSQILSYFHSKHSHLFSFNKFLLSVFLNTKSRLPPHLHSFVEGKKQNKTKKSYLFM